MSLDVVRPDTGSYTLFDSSHGVFDAVRSAGPDVVACGVASVLMAGGAEEVLLGAVSVPAEAIAGV